MENTVGTVNITGGISATLKFVSSTWTLQILMKKQQIHNGV